MELLFPELSYEIAGCCFRVHNALGRFCKEKQYADALEKELQKRNILYRRELNPVTENNDSQGGNRLDFLIEEKVIIELKAKKFVNRQDYYQIQRYLSSAGLELGLLVNFRNTYLKPQRVLNPKLFIHS